LKSLNLKSLLLMAIAFTPLADAVAKLSDKTPVGSVLRSAEWAALPLALREGAQFSAGVESARVLQAVQDRMLGLLKLEREKLANGQEATFDRSSFIDAIRRIAREEGLTPANERDRGTLRDITSIPRLGLIFDMQQARAQEFARWKMDQTEGALMLYPAQEFLRVEDRRVPRDDWPQRWRAAGGQRFGGRMIALKTDPVWERLSIFGTPWPPFDWGSGMGIEDVDRDEAIALGLLAADAEVAPRVEDFNRGLEAGARGLSAELKDALKTHFGPQIDIEGERIKWQSNQGQAYEQQRQEQQRVARSVFGASQGSFEPNRSADGAAEIPDRVLSSLETRWASELAGVAAGRKPLFHEYFPPEVADQIADQLRAAVPVGVQVLSREGQLFAWRPDVLKETVATIQSRANDGNALGYGVNRHDPAAPRVAVNIRDAAGRQVSSFFAPEQGAELFAKARAQDFIDATGQPHRYELVPVKGGRP